MLALTLAALLTVAHSSPPSAAPGCAASPASLAPSDTAAAAGASWQGLFLLDPGQSDDMAEVAERAASGFRRRMRGRVESTLKERLRPSPCLRLSSDSMAIAIEYERGLVWRVSRDGTAESGAARSAGRKVPATLSDSAIAIAGQGDKGEGSYEIRRSADGRRVEVRVSLTGERLKQPISYTLVYRAGVPPAGAS